VPNASINGWLTGSGRHIGTPAILARPSKLISKLSFTSSPEIHGWLNRTYYVLVVRSRCNTGYVINALTGFGIVSTGCVRWNVPSTLSVLFIASGGIHETAKLTLQPRVMPTSSYFIQQNVLHTGLTTFGLCQQHHRNHASSAPAEACHIDVPWARQPPYATTLVLDCTLDR